MMNKFTGVQLPLCLMVTMSIISATTSTSPSLTSIEINARNHARNIDVDNSKRILPKLIQKRKYIKHPLLVTKDDPQDAIVEDNVIVESNILHLIRPGIRKNEIPRTKRNIDAPHKRVTRGWNLQYVIVPQQYYYYKKKKPVRYYY